MTAEFPLPEERVLDVWRWVVEEGERGVRLDKFLARQEDVELTRSQLKIQLMTAVVLFVFIAFLSLGNFSSVTGSWQGLFIAIPNGILIVLFARYIASRIGSLRSVR